MQQKNKKFRLFTILLFFFIVKSGENVFGTTDTSGIAGSFSVGSSHFFLMGSAVIGTLVLINLYNSVSIKLPSIIVAYLTLSILAIISSSWSSSSFKSLGLSFLLLLNLIWSIAIGQEHQRIEVKNRLDQFIHVWMLFFLMNYIIANAAKGVFANLDEFSLISFIIGHYKFSKKKYLQSIVLFALGLTGRSFSALLAYIIFFTIYQISKLRKIFLIPAILLITPIAAIISSVDFISVLDSNEILVFGKNSAGLISGSGRFNAWLTVLDAIESSNILNILFGNGYATDRDALELAGLSWTVDVHNNLLHVLYGLGCVGLLTFFWGILAGLRHKLIDEYQPYRLPILIAFLFFGFSSSYFFGRPSFIGVFWLCFLLSGTDKSVRNLTKS